MCSEIIIKKNILKGRHNHCRYLLLVLIVSDTCFSITSIIWFLIWQPVCSVTDVLASLGCTEVKELFLIWSAASAYVMHIS